MAEKEFTRQLKSTEIDFISGIADSGEALDNFIYLEVEGINQKYSQEILIAEGGSKRIYKVKDEATGRFVAMARPKKSDEVHSEKFLREARITAALEHPNIIPVHDICLDKGQPCFTMKLIEGKTLKKFLQEKVPLQQLLEIFLKVCDAISFAHSRGVLHLDIKPENIQISGHAEVLLCDWGLARIIDSICENPELERFSFDRFEMTHITLDGQIKGTPGYMAPEQAGKGRKTEKTDIYMLGAILFEILYGHPPVEGENLEEVISKTLKGEVSSPEDIEEGRRLKAVVLKALSKAPEDRYSSVDELKTEIEAYCSGFATGAENAGVGQLLYLLYNRNRKVVLTSTFLSAFFLCFIVLFIINLRESEKKATLLVNELQTEKKEKRELAVEAVPRLLEKANAAFMGFRLKEAEHFTDMLLELEPGLDKAWNMKARIHFAQGNTDDLNTFWKEPENHLDKVLKDYSAHINRTGGDVGNKSLLNLIEGLSTSLHPEAVIYLRMLCSHPNSSISSKAYQGILKFSKVNHCYHLLELASQASADMKYRLLKRTAELLLEFPKWPGQTRAASMAMKLTDNKELKSVFQEMTSVNIALFKEVSSIGTTRFPDYRAVDGVKLTREKYWEAEPSPASLTIDLGTVSDFNKVLVYFFFDSHRYYQYKVSVSNDGLHYRETIDMSGNKQKSEVYPFTHRFDTVQARYVRLDMIKNSANPAIHVREIEIFKEDRNLALGQWVFSNKKTHAFLVDGKTSQSFNVKSGEEFIIDLGANQHVNNFILNMNKEVEYSLSVKGEKQKNYREIYKGPDPKVKQFVKGRYFKFKFLEDAEVLEVEIKR